MEAFWTRPTDIVGRVDAEYYRSEFVSAAVRLQKNCDTRAFSQLWKDHNRIYIGIAGFAEVDDKNAYTPYLRPVDITLEGQIQYSSLPWCLLHWLDDWAEIGCAKPGDLLVEVKGNTRKAAVVDERIPKNCIVSGSSYRIQMKAGFDPYFYQAFLTSDTGQLLKRRVTSNTTINYIDPDSFRRFLVPVVDEPIQRAIGNRVRKAERLRELAASARLELDRWIEGNAAGDLLASGDRLFLDHSPSSTIRDWCWATRVATSDRIDPWPHHVAPRTIRSHLQRHGHTITLAQLARRVTSSRPRIEFTDPTQRGHYISVLDVDADGRIDWENARVSRYTGNGLELQPGDILYSRINPRQPRVAAIPTNAKGLLVGSPEFVVLRPLTSLHGHPNLLAVVLRSGWVRVQATFLTRSSSLSRRRIDEEDLDQILVPWSDDRLDEMEGIVMSALDGDVEANELVASARADVESLIDAHSTKAHC